MPEASIDAQSTGGDQSAVDPSRIDADAEQRERHRLRRVVRTTIVLLVLLGLVRVFVFEPYAIPTGSMRPMTFKGVAT